MEKIRVLLINCFVVIRALAQILIPVLQDRSRTQWVFKGKFKQSLNLNFVKTLQVRSQFKLRHHRLIGCLSLVLWLGLTLGMVMPVGASTHAYPQSEAMTMYRSLQSLRDQQDRSWQLVFFDQVNRGQIDTIHLRLVGFPGLALARSPLTIEARTGQTWQVNDLSMTAPASSQLPPNTGEFDLYDVMRNLQEDTVLELKFGLIEGEPVQITVPVAIVREWQTLLANF